MGIFVTIGGFRLSGFQIVFLKKHVFRCSFPSWNKISKQIIWWCVPFVPVLSHCRSHRDTKWPILVHVWHFLFLKFWNLGICCRLKSRTAYVHAKNKTKADNKCQLAQKFLKNNNKNKTKKKSNHPFLTFLDHFCSLAPNRVCWLLFLHIRLQEAKLCRKTCFFRKNFPTLHRSLKLPIARYKCKNLF